jgi:urease accessory protein UreE
MVMAAVSMQRDAIMRERQVVTTATGRQVTILLHKENLIAKSITGTISITVATDPPLL